MDPTLFHHLLGVGCVWLSVNGNNNSYFKSVTMPLTKEQVDKVVALLLLFGGSPSLVLKKWRSSPADSVDHPEIDQPSKNSIKHVRIALCAWLLKENNVMPAGFDNFALDSAAKTLARVFNKKIEAKYKIKEPHKLVIEVFSNHYYSRWLETEGTLSSATELYIRKTSDYAHSIANLSKNKKRGITSVYDEAWEECFDDRSSKKTRLNPFLKEAINESIQERFLTDLQREYLTETVTKGSCLPDTMDNDFITPAFIKEALQREFKLNQVFDPCPIDRSLPEGNLFNGLVLEWPNPDQGIIFINPPYSKTLFQAFIAKAILYVHQSKGTVIALTHRKPLTSKYWLKLEPFIDEIRELHTRINFRASERLIQREEDELERMQLCGELLHEQQIEKQKRRVDNLKGLGKTPHSPVLLIIRPTVSQNRDRANVSCIGNDTRLAYTSVFPCVIPLKKDDIYALSL